LDRLPEHSEQAALSAAELPTASEEPRQSVRPVPEKPLELRAVVQTGVEQALGPGQAPALTGSEVQ
jgi:hypothetical protein